LEEYKREHRTRKEKVNKEVIKTNRHRGCIAVDHETLYILLGVREIKVAFMLFSKYLGLYKFINLTLLKFSFELRTLIFINEIKRQAIQFWSPTKLFLVELRVKLYYVPLYFC
jgi:hypothetical protein